MNFQPILDRRNVIVAGVASFSIGGALGYILGKKRTLSQFEIIEPHEVTNVFPEEEELEEAAERTRLSLVIDAEDMEVIRQRGEQFVSERVKDELEEEETIIEVTEVTEGVRTTIFAEDDDDWNYEQEIARRDRRVPYVIHRDEFYEDSEGLTQTTLTYYAGDDIMVDENDAPVYNYATVVGPLRFGHGSNDPNTFYVRNENAKGEYEILRHEGLYSVEVMGLEIEHNERARDLKHSNTPGKFREY